MIVKVAFDLPNRKLFEYRINESSLPIELGTRVLAPLGNSKRLGVVMGTSDQASIDKSKLKFIQSKLTDVLPLGSQMVNFLNQAAISTQLPIGKIVFAALPTVARRKTYKSNNFTVRNFALTKLKTRKQTNLDKVAKKLVTKLSKEISDQNHCNYLLQGLPGTNKAVIATELIHTCLLQKKVALVIVPSINHATSVVKRLQHEFPDCNIETYHSKLKTSQQFAVWEKAQVGNCHILVGTRSAIFTPLTNLGIICILNENDRLHRADRGLIYSARDLAAIRGRVENCLVLMTAIIPSVELRHSFQANRLQMTVLPKPTDYQNFDVKIVDVAHRRLFGGISPEIEVALRDELQRGKLCVVLSLQRTRGETIYCAECKHILQCKVCNNNLTQLTKTQCLCKRCGFGQDMPSTCPACGGSKLGQLQTGSSQIAEALSTRLPNAMIQKINATTNLDEINQLLHKKQIDILVGSQLMHGLDIQPSTLIVTNADSVLHSSVYRASEYLLDSIYRLAFRKQKVNLLIQTCFPNHHLFQALEQNNYEIFAHGELKIRQQLGLPPFRRLALLSASCDDEAKLAMFTGAAKQLATPFCEHKNISLLEPVIAKAKSTKKPTIQLLISAHARKDLLEMLEQWLVKLEGSKMTKGIAWNLEVDPEKW